MNYLWIYFEIKYMILNKLHIIIRSIFPGWLFHANAGKWYLLKQLRKCCALVQFLFDQALALLLASYVNCQFEFHLGVVVAAIIAAFIHVEYVEDISHTSWFKLMM